MKPVQATVREHAAELPRSEAEREQLPAGDHPRLTFSQPRES